MTQSRWSDEFLNGMRDAGDPLADETIRRVYEAGQVADVNRIMRALVENDDLPTDDLPPIVKSYLDQTRHLPPWADLQKMRHGGQLFARYGPEIVLMLFGASLPALYAAHPGCQVLIATRRMTHNVHRRIIETGQFVIDITEPRAWEADGRAILTTQKVRLMHAAIRHYLTREERWRAHWKPQWGVPICQEDLMGTMLSFSTQIIQSLEMSNMTLSPAEKDSYLHLWKVIGFLLGIDERLMPEGYDESQSLFRQWTRRNHHPNETSRELMEAMIDFWYVRVPGRLFDGITSGLCRMWIGDELADALRVPPFNWTRHLLKMQNQIWKYEEFFEDRFVPYQAFTRFWTRRLMKALMLVERDGKRPDFRIPESLQQRWGL